MTCSHEIINKFFEYILFLYSAPNGNVFNWTMCVQCTVCYAIGNKYGIIVYCFFIRSLFLLIFSQKSVNNTAEYWKTKAKKLNKCAFRSEIRQIDSWCVHEIKKYHAFVISNISLLNVLFNNTKRSVYKWNIFGTSKWIHFNLLQCRNVCVCVCICMCTECGSI